tara:strand:- start:1111 stop:2277 length:1167 start_codon:yes stop_codon:yes gene_type:complete
MRALVIHTRRTGLGLIRSLGKKKVQVYSADEYKSPGFYSKFVNDSFIIPDIIKNGENSFIERMVEIGEEIGGKDKIFLFTSSDNYLLVISKYWNVLSKYYVSISEVDEKKLLDSLYKDRMYKVANKAGVSHPRTFYSEDYNIDEIEFPVVIKPTIRKTSNSNVGESVFKIKKCFTESQLFDAVSELKKSNSSFVIQEFIPGDDNQLYTVGLYAYKGKVIASATAKKLRQFPPFVGECSYGELVSDPEAILEAEKYIKESGISGICQIEFKKYKKVYYLMEINPRPWSWNSIIEYAGLNLPYIACKTILKPYEKIKYTQKRFHGTWVFSLMDFKHHVLLNKNISIFTFIYNLLFSNRHAYFDLYDPLPLLAAIFQFIKKPLKSLSGKSN